jgi:hypothetical protein
VLASAMVTTDADRISLFNKSLAAVCAQVIAKVINVGPLLFPELGLLFSH